MYSRFVKAVKYAVNAYSGTQRGQMMEDLLLLTDENIYHEAKRMGTSNYQIISEVQHIMTSIDITQPGYHRFGYFQEVLAFIGLSPDIERYNIEAEKTNFLISVIKQILNFEYQS